MSDLPVDPELRLADIIPAVRRYLLHKVQGFAYVTLPLHQQSLANFLYKPATALQVADYFGWQLEPAQRLLRLLAQGKILTETKDATKQPSYAACADPRPHVASTWEQLLYKWLDQETGTAAPDDLALYRDDPPWSAGRALIGILNYYHHVVSRFVQPTCINQALAENRSGVRVALGLSSDQIFDHYQSDPALLRVYSEGFTGGNYRANRFFVQLLPKEENLSVLDVGGGSGVLAAQIGLARPRYGSIAVYDLPQAHIALEQVRRSFAQHSPVPLMCIAGDMLRETRAGLDGIAADLSFDVIVLGWILHDWDDPTCVGILQRLRRHLRPGGRVYILEKVITDENSPMTLLTDFIMFLMASGYERRLEQYSSLLQAAGLELWHHHLCSEGRDVLIARETTGSPMK